MAKKSSTVFVCENCGHEETKWLGQCPSCGEWNTLVEQAVVRQELGAMKAQISASSEKVTSLRTATAVPTVRASTHFEEFDQVLGGGFITGQVILFAGEPGIGKSTLILQVSGALAQNGANILYASAEESLTQVSSRAQRIYGKKDIPEINFLGSASLQGIVEAIEGGEYKMVVVDSIQTIFDERLAALPGTLTQIKSCASQLISLAKRQGVVLVLIGHINKEGTIAGPKVLEHLVDTVLQLDGERSGEYRLLRSLKNRFGPTGEVGMFTMEEQGMKDLDPATSPLISTNESVVGVARTVSLEGNRTVFVEVQALTNNSIYAYPKRLAEGVSSARLQLICAIIDKYTEYNLNDKDIFVKTAGGYDLRHPASDLGIAVAIISSFLKREIAPDSLFAGELALSGRVSLPRYFASKLTLAAKLNISKIYSPLDTPSAKNLKSVKVSDLTQLFKK
jgi:DNA repair protein RadA/Sms